MIISRCYAFFLLFTMFFILSICGMDRCENKLIIVMGASCSGKSTLSKKLLQHLGNEWKFVELDEIEDKFKAKKITITDDELIDAVINRANEHLAKGCSVLIDTNMYDHKFAQIHCDCNKFIYVYCPLQVLLKRDAARDHRSSQDARYAQEYVIKTFHNFEHHQHYNIKIDSSLLSLDESVEQVIRFIS